MLWETDNGNTVSIGTRIVARKRDIQGISIRGIREAVKKKGVSVKIAPSDSMQTAPPKVAPPDPAYISPVTVKEQYELSLTTFNVPSPHGADSPPT